MTHYRDPLAGLLSQVATKRGVVLDREKRVTPVLRALLPPHIEERIAQHRDLALDETADSMETLSRTDAALDALSSVYEEALFHEDEARRLAFELAEPPRPDIPAPWLIEEEMQLRFRKVVHMRLGMAMDDEAVPLVRWGDFGYLSRFRRAGEPHSLLVEAGLDSNKVYVVSFGGTLRATMPERVPTLDLRAQRGHLAVGRALGLVNEMVVGDEAFDDAFIIQGHRGALAFLTPPIRGALLAFADKHPRLRFARGAMSFEWRLPWDGDRPLRIDAALNLADRLHALAASG